MLQYLSRLFVVLSIALLPIGGCLTTYTPTAQADQRPKEVYVSHSVGGTHWRTLVDNGVWFQGFGPNLLVLDTKNAAVLDKLTCFPVGNSGALVDLVKYQGDLIAVLDRTAVLRIDRTNPTALMVVETINEKALGVRPESISVVDGDLYVSGLGGIVRLDTGERFLTGGDVCGRVVGTAIGRVATRKGEIIRLSDSSILGRATDLQNISSLRTRSPSIAFVDQEKTSARVGILDSNLKEISAVSVHGEVIRLREIAGRLWAVTPKGITTWKIGNGGLTDEQTIRVRGALDIDMVGSNTYAIAGTFGRALYRLQADVGGPADEFFSSTREAGKLERILTDGRRIVAGSDEGNWLYITGGSCEPSNNPIQTVNPPSSVALGEFGKASIEGADSDVYTIESAPRVVVENNRTKQTIQMPQGAHARTIATVGSDLWIGHDDGIDVWRMDGTKMVRVGRLRLQGPVTNIFARRTNDGVSWVSLYGGMGVVLWRPIEDGAIASDSTTTSAN
ncbi:MAG: hypothetical protein O2875_02615 [Planctomycetota bacterium]|nr:hypothetical protein [Planctomycetota bacterium]MDA1262279.1 hypothetical protein [Planctomycetota bacterium]